MNVRERFLRDSSKKATTIKNGVKLDLGYAIFIIRRTLQCKKVIKRIILYYLSCTNNYISFENSLIFVRRNFRLRNIELFEKPKFCLFGL